MRHALATGAAAAVILLVACAAPASPTVSPTPEPEPTPKEAEPTPSAEQRTPKPSSTSQVDGIELRGTLGLEDIEGGCPYLRAADGTRYEVIYPDGWELRPGPVERVSPDGEVVARSGDEVAVRGREATDMASICQIGPIFVADEVASID